MDRFPAENSLPFNLKSLARQHLHANAFSLIKSSPSGIYLKHAWFSVLADGCIVEANALFLKLIGRTGNETLGCSLTQLQLDTLDLRRQQTLNQGFIDTQIEFIGEAGTRCSLELQLLPIRP